MAAPSHQREYIPFHRYTSRAHGNGKGIQIDGSHARIFELNKPDSPISVIDGTTRHVLPEETWSGEERDKRIRGGTGVDVFGTEAFSVYGPTTKSLPVPYKQYGTDISVVDDLIAKEAKLRENTDAKSAQLLRHGLAYSNGKRTRPILAAPNVDSREYTRRRRAAKKLIEEYEYEPSSPDDDDDEDDEVGPSEGKWEGRLTVLKEALTKLEQPPQPEPRIRGATSLHRSATKRRATEIEEDSGVQAPTKRQKSNNLQQTPDVATPRQQDGCQNFGLSFLEALDIAMAEERKSRDPRRSSNPGYTTEEEEPVYQAPRPRKRRNVSNPGDLTPKAPETPLRTNDDDEEEPYVAIERYMARTFRRDLQGDELAAAYNKLMQEAHPGAPIRSAESLMRQTGGGAT
ncbi:hypothetical protein Q7P37_005941 [Cladosporium fusiforme]